MWQTIHFLKPVLYSVVGLGNNSSIYHWLHISLSMSAFITLCNFLLEGSVNVFPLAVGNVLPVTRWLILSSAYKSWQSMIISHRAVDQLHSWDSSINMKLLNCSVGYHSGLSGLICRALSQQPSYKETFSFRYLLAQATLQSEYPKNLGRLWLAYTGLQVDFTSFNSYLLAQATLQSQ